MEAGASGVLGHPVQQLATMEHQAAPDCVTTQCHKMEDWIVQELVKKIRIAALARVVFVSDEISNFNFNFL